MQLDVAVALPSEETIPKEWLVALLAEPGVPKASRIARVLVVDVNTMSRWKLGKSPISKSRWLAILSAAGKPADWQPAPPPPTTH